MSDFSNQSGPNRLVTLTPTKIPIRTAKARLKMGRGVTGRGEEPVAGNSMLVEFTLTPEGDEMTRLRVVESGHEMLAWPEAEKERYADEHHGGWGEYLDRLATLLGKRQSG